MLLGRGWREGVWDSVMAGTICKWIMEVEEEGMMVRGGCGYVPEWSRVKGAEVSFDLKERRAQVRCLRKISEEGEEVGVREVEIGW